MKTSRLRRVKYPHQICCFYGTKMHLGYIIDVGRDNGMWSVEHYKHEWFKAFAMAYELKLSPFFILFFIIISG